ncbi:imm11 family protein [Stagnihabitans tardus]|uniref:Immunity MXAN-0049 protein domain-containing protein n=1 Tax=Stagnihabitans tardus TaxID=2699202 RepID=A0AAE4YCJ3_9RHOB|nr:DUF1629 domain-containing protein [Stagnihabitans tardus]NBZ89529.1 hypothetical protein [Stagnihabitans tardus]
MVWGIVLPTGFGKHFPRSDFVGWKEHLSRRLKDLAPEVKAMMDGSVADYCYRVSEAFTREVRNPARSQSPVRMPDIDELPQEIRLEGAHTDLAAFFMTRDRMLAVDEQLRTIIEALEPGGHVFWPLRLTTSKGADLPKRYFGLIIGRFLDSFDLEATPPESVTGTGYQRQASGMTMAVFATLAFRADQIGTSHLWRERRLLRPRVFLSDILQAEILKAGLNIPKHHKVKTI